MLFEYLNERPLTRNNVQRPAQIFQNEVGNYVNMPVLNHIYTCAHAYDCTSLITKLR